MKDSDNKLNPLEWIAAVAWVVFWDTFAYKAIIEKAISLGARFGFSNVNGFAAVMLGLAMIGVSLLGVFWLLRLNPFRSMLQFLFLLAWVSGSIIYLVYFYH